MNRCLPLGAAIAAGCLAPGLATAADRPNIVVILADDLGYRDIGYHGSSLYETPNIDRLFEAGLHFHQAYASGPVCSPTRASLLTGKTPARLKFTTIHYPPYHGRPLGPGDPGDWPAALRLIQPNSRQALPRAETTLPEVLGEHGYRTALIGKWHLGPFRRKDGVPDHDPRDHGFDVAAGWGSAGSPYFPPYYVNNLAPGEKTEYLTDRLTEEAVAFIRANKDRPFYLQLSHFAVHSPWQAPEAATQRFEGRVDPEAAQRNPTYAAMIRRLDASVGRVREALRTAGVAGRTLVVFTSDNGPVENVNRGEGAPDEAHDGFTHGDHITSVDPFRGDKGTLFEGGIRVPTAIHWPQAEATGASEVPVATRDIMPTALDLAGIDPGSLPEPMDGRSLMPLLAGENFDSKRSLHFHYPHYTPGYQPPGQPEPFKQRPAAAIRKGKWKLIHFFENGDTSLYNLEKDPGETNDRASRRSDLAARLRTELFGYLREADAQLPRLNPKNPAVREQMRRAPRELPRF